MDVVGSSMFSFLLNNYFHLDLVLKKGQQDVVVERAVDYDESKRTEAAEQVQLTKNNKLINIIYNEGEYYVTEPKNLDSSRHNIIDNHLWLIAKFMPDVSN